MPLADFHFQVKHIKRSSGQSAVACAAYRACEKLHSDYYNETNDYSKKGGLIHSEIDLPEYVPKEFSDREYLWNSVERAEKRKDAQLAYSFDFALMNEFTIKENISIARSFILDNFVARGMICDWAFHFPDKDDGIDNPHIHLMCPVRPMNEDGTWGTKQKNVYMYDENGEVLRDDNGRKKYKSVKTTDWSDPETLVAWRRAWADINNEMFELKGMKERISAESLEAQGLDLIPTIHEGPAVREMEKRGIVTEKGEFNRQVKKLNGILTLIRECFSELFEWINILKEKPPKEPHIFNLVSDYYEERRKNSYTNNLKAQNLKQFAEAIAFMQAKNIRYIADLESEITSQQKLFDSGNEKRKAVREQITELNRMKGRLRSYYANKDIAEKYKRKNFGKEKFYSEHKKEIDKFYGAKKNIPKELLSDEDWEKNLDRQIKTLTAELESYSAEIEPVKTDLDKLLKIKWCIGVASGDKSDGEEKLKEPERAEPDKPAKKKSILAELEKNKAKVRENERQKKSPARNGQER